MRAEKIQGLLGTASTDLRLRRELLEEGISLQQELYLPEGEYRAYIGRPNLGYCLVFTDEAMFLGIPDQPIGQGPLFLSSCFFYTQGKDGYAQYPHPLPGQVSFSDTQPDLAHKLGPADWQRQRSDGAIASQRWNLGPYHLHLTYAKGSGLAEIVSFALPDRDAL